MALAAASRLELALSELSKPETTEADASFAFQLANWTKEVDFHSVACAVASGTVAIV